MSFDISDGLKNLAPGNLDALRGPYPTIAAACAAIPSVVVEGRNYREGKIVDIGAEPNTKSYRWSGGFSDHNLEEQVPVTKDEITQIKSVTVNFEIDDEGNFAIASSDSGNIAFLIKQNGNLQTLDIDAQAVFSKTFKSYMYELGDTEDYLIAIHDAKGNIGWGIGLDGKILGQIDNGLIQPLLGKNISFLGDSITTTNYNSLTTNTVYWGLLKSWLGINVFTNAISNTTIAETTAVGTVPFTNDARWQSLNSTFTPDGIVVFGSTNDFHYNVPIGLITDSVKTTFYGALKYLLTSIMARVPKAKIFFMTPLHRSDKGSPLEINTSGVYLYQYVDAIKEVCGKYGVTVINTYQESGLTYYNMNAGNYAPDGLHPNSAGHYRLAEVISHKLLNHFK